MTSFGRIWAVRIKASQMEAMFRLSANGIRLYEKHGIIMPSRQPGSAYRVYSEEEMQAMGCAIQMRRYGYDMKQTAHLLGGMNEAEQLEAMAGRVDDMEAEIDRMMRVRRSLRTHVQRAARAQTLLDTCVLEDKPAMYFLGSQRGDALVSAGAGAMVGEWINRYAPHLSAAMLLDGPYFTQEGYDRPPLAGVAVDAEMALELGLCPAEEVSYLPPKPCILTAVRDENGLGLDAGIARVKRYAAEHRLALYAGGFLRLVQCVRRDGRLVTTALLWARLARDDKEFGQMK